MMELSDGVVRWRQTRPAQVPPFSMKELKQTCRRLKIGKAPGPDGLPNEAIRDLATNKK